MLTIYFAYLGTLVVPSLVALILWRSVQREYKPMLAFSWLLLFLEISRSFFEEGSLLSLIGYNLHSLLELLLLLFIAHRWGSFQKRPGLLPLLILLAIAGCVAEKFIVGWDQRISWFRIAVAFIMVCLAVDFLVRIPAPTSMPLWKNPVVLFSTFIGLSYAAGGLFEIATVALNNPSPSFIVRAFYFGIVVNSVANLILLISYLCISKRARFSFL